MPTGTCRSGSTGCRASSTTPRPRPSLRPRPPARSLLRSFADKKRPGESRGASRFRSRRRDSNPRHRLYKSRALPTDLLRRRSHGRRSSCCLIWTRPSRGDRQLVGMDHPKDIGDRTTLAVMLALRSEGRTILIPFGEDTRYDLVIEEADRFARVQVQDRAITKRRSLLGEGDHYASHQQKTVSRNACETHIPTRSGPGSLDPREEPGATSGA